MPHQTIPNLDSHHTVPLGNRLQNGNRLDSSRLLSYHRMRLKAPTRYILFEAVGSPSPAPERRSESLAGPLRGMYEVHVAQVWPRGLKG